MSKMIQLAECWEADADGFIAMALSGAENAAECEARATVLLHAARELRELVDCFVKFIEGVEERGRTDLLEKIRHL